MEPSKVLIADDSPLALRTIEKLLTEAGLAVVTARDGLEALDKVVSDDIDLVILDVMMPRMNGYQACRLLKSEPTTRGVPVVILTSKDQEGDRFWGLETGADYYITKDSEPQRIMNPAYANQMSTVSPQDAGLVAAGVQARLARAIREGAPNHTIIAAGANWSSSNELLALEPLHDSNIIYNFHFYDPHWPTVRTWTWCSWCAAPRPPRWSRR